MDLNKIPLFAALTKKMAWLNQRQKVLAQNIANSDTPGYRPKDLKELTFREMVGSANRALIPKATNAGHIQIGSASGYRVRAETQPFESAPGGNAVILEEQMMKVQENQIDYELTTNLYKKHIGMLKTALGRRQ